MEHACIATWVVHECQKDPNAPHLRIAKPVVFFQIVTSKPIFFPRSHSKVSQDMIDNMLTAFMNGTFELYPVFIVCFVLYTLHNFFFGGKLNI